MTLRSPAASAPLGLKALVLYLGFVAAACLAFADQEIWSDEAISLMLIGGHDPALIGPGTHTSASLEALSDATAKAPLREVWRFAAERDNHPPGYATLFAALFHAGLDPRDTGTIRMLSIAFSGTFIFAALPLMREFGREPDWLTAAIFAVSPFALYLARDIRPYGLVLALSLTSLYLVTRYRRANAGRWLWLAALFVVNAAGLLMHKLFLGVVAGELAYIAFSALAHRPLRARAIVELVVFATVTAVLASLVPNLLTAGPRIGGFDTAWLETEGSILEIASALVTYLAYLGTWWIAVPEAALGTWSGIAYLAAFIPLALWTVVLTATLVRTERRPGNALLFLVPLALLVAALAAGLDFSRAPRYSAIWVPACALWLLVRLESGRLRTAFLAYAGFATTISSLLVLTDAAHRSPDRARDFLSAFRTTDIAELVWVTDDTLNSRGLLLALHSEMQRAGVVPPRILIVDAKTPPSSAATGRLIASPRRFGARFAGACGPEAPIEIGSYSGCRATP